MPGYLKYARGLTFEQWREAFLTDGPLSRAIIREMDSFPEREPMRSFVDGLSLELPANPDGWDIHNVSISDASCSLFVSFEYGAFSEKFSGGAIAGAEPVETDVAGDQDYYLFDVSAVFHVNDDGNVVSSEILDVCAQTHD